MIHLDELAERINTFLVEEQIVASVVFGRSHLFRKDNQSSFTANRVVVADGDPDGNLLRVNAPFHNHHTRPDMLTEWRSVTVQVWGYVPGKPNDERAQSRALNYLLSPTLRSIQQALLTDGHRHTLYQSKATYPTLPVERVHGKLAQIVFEVAMSNRAPAPAQSYAAEVDTVEEKVIYVGSP